MRDSVKVAAVQMDIRAAQPEDNLTRIGETIDRICSEDHADLVVFPELANSGYIRSAYRDFGTAFARLAERIPGPFTETLGAQARKRNLFIVAGMLQAHPVIPATLFNSAVLLGPSGQVIGIHHKMHIPGQERCFFYPGNTSNVFCTEIGNLAMSICTDSVFPELARVLSLKGAEIICGVFSLPRFNPSGNSTWGRLHHLVACRAMENVNYYVASSRVGTHDEKTFTGQSCIAAPDGELIASAGTDAEEIVRATLYDHVLREQRAIFPFFRDRRPENYSLLSEPF